MDAQSDQDLGELVVVLGIKTPGGPVPVGQTSDPGTCDAVRAQLADEARAVLRRVEGSAAGLRVVTEQGDG